MGQDKQAAPVSVPLCEQCHGQMRLSNSFPGYLFLPASYLQTFAFSDQRCWRPPARTPRDNYDVWIGKTSKQPQSLCLCASSAMDRWGWATAIQASSFWLRVICRLWHFQSRAAGGPLHGSPILRL